ncbi:MAG: phospho-sugar mutase, partial [Oscillospiraceae bacterium]|nr:phospho-sugar mutase [Oscillospiraceae bacterium]
ASGMQRMQEIMASLRANAPKTIGGVKVVAVADYKASTKTCAETGAVEALTLPKSDVITFYLADDASVIIRPSGTEPKIKVYYTTKGAEKADAMALQSALSADFTKILGF